MKIHRAFWLVCRIGGLLQSFYGYGQQGATDSAFAAKPAPFWGSIGLDFRFSGGNIRQALVRANANLFLEEKNLIINPYILFTQNVIFGNKLESDVFSFLLLKAWHHAKVYPVAAILYERSLVRSIDLRYMGGAGAGWNLIAAGSATLELIQLIVYEKNHFAVNKNINYEGVRTHTSAIGKYRLLQNRISIEHRIFYSVLLRDTDNHRLRTLVTLRVPVTKKFSLTANFDYIFENIVDERRAKENYITTGGLNFQF